MGVAWFAVSVIFLVSSSIVDSGVIKWSNSEKETAPFLQNEDIQNYEGAFVESDPTQPKSTRKEESTAKNAESSLKTRGYSQYATPGTLRQPQARLGNNRGYPPSSRGLSPSIGNWAMNNPRYQTPPASPSSGTASPGRWGNAGPSSSAGRFPRSDSGVGASRYATPARSSSFGGGMSRSPSFGGGGSGGLGGRSGGLGGGSGGLGGGSEGSGGIGGAQGRPGAASCGRKKVDYGIDSFPEMYEYKGNIPGIIGQGADGTLYAICDKCKDNPKFKHLNFGKPGDKNGWWEKCNEGR